MQDNEKRFEQDIESYLLSSVGGYLKGELNTYDRKKAIDMKTLVTFYLLHSPMNGNDK